VLSDETWQGGILDWVFAHTTARCGADEMRRNLRNKMYVPTATANQAARSRVFSIDNKRTTAHACGAEENQRQRETNL
jgi:hypothetical protein